MAALAAASVGDLSGTGRNDYLWVNTWPRRAAQPALRRTVPPSRDGHHYHTRDRCPADGKSSCARGGAALRPRAGLLRSEQRGRRWRPDHTWQRQPRPRAVRPARRFLPRWLGGRPPRMSLGPPWDQGGDSQSGGAGPRWVSEPWSAERGCPRPRCREMWPDGAARPGGPLEVKQNLGPGEGQAGPQTVQTV